MPRGRPRKVQSDVVPVSTTDGLVNPGTANFMQIVGDLPTPQPYVITTSATKSSYPPVPNRILRDDDGLLINVEYKFKGNGFVDWRSMIPEDYVVLNREKFLKKETPVDVDKLSELDYKILFDKSEDKDKVIKLAGLKEVAQIRGYYSMKTKVTDLGNGPVATCTIQWMPNFETNGQYIKSTGVGEANPSNTHGVASKYPAAIAENRAVSRAIRNFLMIHTVSDEEVKHQNTGEFGEKPDAKTGPQYVLEKRLAEKKKPFAEFQQYVMENPDGTNFVGAEVWEKSSDMNASDATAALGMLEGFLNKK